MRPMNLKIIMTRVKSDFLYFIYTHTQISRKLKYSSETVYIF